MPPEQESTFTQLPPDVQQQLCRRRSTCNDLITAFVATVLRSRDLERGDCNAPGGAGIALCSERVCALPGCPQGNGVWLSAGADLILPMGSPKPLPSVWRGQVSW
jgi:hypothetical protein